ncbi:unnamed protein product [Aureobasidium pullulans]|nr:unnamed protein product [Aureobasidium pullulans]
MASNNVCNSCIRTLRQGPTRQVNGRIVHTRLSPRGQFLGRTFATTASRLEAGKPQEGPDASTMQKFAQRMRAQKQMKAATEPYVAYGATEDLFRACARAGEYTMPTVAEGEEPLRSAKGEDLGLGLAPTFNTWAQITYLHMYIVTVRLRMFPQQHAHHWHQNLLDHFSYAAEDRMVSLHNIAARSVRNKYLKDLFGDAVLASAVWRNIFAGDENVDAAAVANVVSYLKKNLRDFDRIADSDIASGDISFSDAVREAALVDRESRAMKQPIPEPTPTAPRV